MVFIKMFSLLMKIIMIVHGIMFLSFFNFNYVLFGNYFENYNNSFLNKLDGIILFSTF